MGFQYLVFPYRIPKTPFLISCSADHYTPANCFRKLRSCRSLFGECKKVVIRELTKIKGSLQIRILLMLPFIAQIVSDLFLDQLQNVI